MDSYRIIVTPDAKADITELRDYIANVLLSPKTARSYIQNLRKEIGKLSEMPTRIKLIDDEPWHSRGVRKFIVRNFLVYFRVEEDKKTVYILNVIYAKRDQLCLQFPPHPKPWNPNPSSRASIIGCRMQHIIKKASILPSSGAWIATNPQNWGKAGA